MQSRSRAFQRIIVNVFPFPSRENSEAVRPVPANGMGRRGEALRMLQLWTLVVLQDLFSPRYREAAPRPVLRSGHSRRHRGRRLGFYARGGGTDQDTPGAAGLFVIGLVRGDCVLEIVRGTEGIMT